MIATGCFAVSTGVAKASPSIAIVDADGSAYSQALIGSHVAVYVNLSAADAIGRAEIRVQYQFPGLTFLGATAVGDFESWEFFTWRHVPDTLFPDTGVSAIQLSAVADLDNGAYVHPDPLSLTPDGNVIRLLFWTSSDRRHINNCHGVTVTGFECGQTAIENAAGDVVYIPVGSDPSCFSSQGKTVVDVVDLANGSVCTTYPPSDEGDINLDGVQFNIGDLVLFNRYLTYGPDVWDLVWSDIQSLSTDVNGDGVVGTVEDLHFLLRIISQGPRFQFQGQP